MGTVIALFVLFVALLTALGLIHGEALLWWLLAGLALAVVLGAGWPAWLPRPAART